ncbi:MAG: LLM class F420-dependent oxidoreductase [Acidimicrobiia bacterium]|nr:LLM class F420-dependent oxidoreductase [Acidimicrobiia bacterium]
MTRLGYQIPNFTYPDTRPADLFGTIARQAREADASGFDTVMVMDHFYQLPMLGSPDLEMLECYTLLAALAQHTSTVRLSALVTGNTYRNPALLAKTLTTLDIVSDGRAQLGIGAGWFELEHDSLGFEFGTFTQRFEKLEEALRIIKGMFAGEKPTVDGTWYQVKEAINSPAPLGPIPIMIGGGGEKKTLRLVAQYADESNLICSVDEIPRKLDALAGHCDRLGRDRSEITVSYQGLACIGPTHDEAVADLDALFATRGMVMSSLSAEDAASMRAMVPHGDPDEIGELFSTYLVAGVDGFTVSAPANGHVEGRVSLLGETLAAVISSRQVEATAP